MGLSLNLKDYRVEVFKNTFKYVSKNVDIKETLSDMAYVEYLTYLNVIQSRFGKSFSQIALEVFEANSRMFDMYKKEYIYVLNKNNFNLKDNFEKIAENTSVEFYKFGGTPLLIIPVENSDVRSVIISPYFCYLYKEDRLFCVYRYKANTIREAVFQMTRLVEEYNLPSWCLDIAKSMKAQYEFKI